MNKIPSVEWVQKTFMQVLEGWATDWELASLIVLVSQELSQERAPPSLLAKVLCWEEAKRKKKKKSLPIRKSSEQDSDLTINLEEW